MARADRPVSDRTRRWFGRQQTLVATLVAPSMSCCPVPWVFDRPCGRRNTHNTAPQRAERAGDVTLPSSLAEAWAWCDWRGSSTCATMGFMATVGLRELRQSASEIVRRVESGEEIDITVTGRLAARIVPAAPKRWRRWDDVADVVAGRPDPDWERDRVLGGQSVEDPWERSR